MNVVIAGASSGIGAALWKRLETGHTLMGLSRTAAKTDLAIYSDVVTVAAMQDTFTHLDALIITAGHQPTLGRIETSDPAAWHNAITANLGVTFNAIRAFYPLLKRSRRAKVVALGGGGASQGRPYFSSYACAKTGVVRLMETLAMEEPGWDCNVIAPGAINTRMVDDLLLAGEPVVGRNEMAKAMSQKLTGGDSMDAALDLIEWLISPESDGISGKFISAKWDDWRTDANRMRRTAELFKLRRVTP